MNTTTVASNNPCIQVFTTKRLAKGEIMGPLWGGTIYVEPYDTGDKMKGVGVKMMMAGIQRYSPSDLKHLTDRLSEIHEVLVQ